ncbi:MAG: hypothetical protein ABJJ25_05950 [Eudoraea sp.]|uniref:baeRF7 domain-containing protein n=1 Tax=Eudoraea sp. TaxID=1979955 RepID=UPI00326458EF
MNNFLAHTFTKKTFEQLAAIKDQHCISIYLPMYKKGKEQNEGMGQSNLKSCLKKVHTLLAEYGMHETKINTYLKPIRNLIFDLSLWRNPSEGLAIFLDRENGIRYYKLPLSFEIKTYVADHFYLIPLLPLFHNNGIYYLLELSRDYIKLYKGSRNNFRELQIKKIIPKQLEEVVGYDFEQNMLQYRTGHMMYPAGSFHGQGEGKEDEKKELVSFFRKVNQGVAKIISNKKTPLILACTDELYPIYKKINSYHKLWDTNLSGDPEFKGANQLHKESWGLVQYYFETTMREKLAKFIDKFHTTKTSWQLSEIIPAAVKGKIDTLFVQQKEDVFGTYNSSKGCLILDSRKEMRNISLLNMAAICTFLQGGNVFFLEKEEMQVKNISMNALFRF